MEEFIDYKEIEFNDQWLNKYINDLKNCYFSNQNVFAKVCFTIHSIWLYCKDNYYLCTKGVYYNSYSLLKLFGFDRKAVSRYKACYSKFCFGSSLDTICLLDRFIGFSSSKLFELLPLANNMIDACLEKQIIKPTMTVKEIRQKVKDLAGKNNPADLVAEDLDKIEEKTLDEQEAELPEAFDPKKTHTYEYFKAMSKEALITCLFQCEDYIKKLTTKKVGK